MLYQPGHGKFTVDDPPALLADICRHGAATLVTFGTDGFRTTTLPFQGRPPAAMDRLALAPDRGPDQVRSR